MPLCALQVRSGDCQCLTGNAHQHTLTFPTPLQGRSSLIDEEIDGKLQCPSWWMTSFGPMCWSQMPKQIFAQPPVPPLFVFLPTIDQCVFCTQASFDFNAWGGGAVDAALYCVSQSLDPPPLSLLSHPSLCREVWAMTDPVSVCLFTLICRQSVSVKGPFCFQMDYCLHKFNYRR